MLNPKDHVVKRGSSDSFYCDFYTKPADGGRPQRVFRSLKTNNKAEAIELCTRMIEKYYPKSIEAIRADQTLTLQRLFEMFLETKKASSLNTQHFYEVGKAVAKKYFPEGFLVRDLDTTKMSKYHAWIVSQGKAPDTVRHYLNTLKIIFNWAWQSQIIRTNQIKLFKLPRGSGDRLNWFSPVQLEDILAGVKEPNYGTVLALAHTGARKTSVLKMEWDWIDFGKRVIEFPEWVIKTRIKVRVPMSDTLEAYLLAKREKMTQAEDGQSKEVPKYVFSLDGGKTHIRGLRDQYNRVLRKLGLKGNVHSLRHSFATNYLDHNPGDLKGLSQVLGWRDPKMAMKYAHVTQRAFEEQRTVINEMYRTKRTDTEPSGVSAVLPANVTPIVKSLVTNVVTDDLSPKVRCG